MADAILTLVDGTDIAAYDTAAWHNKGNVTGRLMKSTEALLEAAFNRVEVIEEPLFTKTGPVETHKVVRLKDDQDNYYKPFVVGKDRPTFDFKFLLETVEQAMHVTGGTISSVFRLRDGALVGATLKMPETVTVAGDKYQQFFNIVDSIDASCPTRMFSSDIRMVCWNTVRWAMNSRDKSRTFTMKHTKNASLNLRAEDIRAAVQMGIKQDAEVEALMAKLVEEETTKREFFKMVDGIFGTPDPLAKTTRSKTIYDNRMATLSGLWVSDTQASTYRNGKPTLATSFQTLVEYIDHQRPVKGKDPKAVRFASNLDGSADLMKGKVLTALGVSV